MEIDHLSGKEAIELVRAHNCVFCGADETRRRKRRSMVWSADFSDATSNRKDHFRRNDLFLKRDLQAIYRIANAISMIGEPMGTFGGRIPISSPEGVPPNGFVSERRTGRFLSPAVEAFAGVIKAEVDWKVKEGSDWYVAGLADVLYTG